MANANVVHSIEFLGIMAGAIQSFWQTFSSNIIYYINVALLYDFQYTVLGFFLFPTHKFIIYYILLSSSLHAYFIYDIFFFVCLLLCALDTGLRHGLVSSIFVWCPPRKLIESPMFMCIFSRNGITKKIQSREYSFS